MSERDELKEALAELDVIREWLSVPDTAERFTARDMVDWANQRPKANLRRARELIANAEPHDT